MTATATIISLKRIISNFVNDLNIDRGIFAYQRSFPTLLNAADSRSSLNSQHHDAGDLIARYIPIIPRHDLARMQWASVQLLVYSRTNGRHARMHPPRGICTAFIGSVKFD